jgi:hypothetical protein
MSNPLKKAINSLVIHDVYLRNSDTVLSEDFEPKYEDKNTSYNLQFKYFVEKAQVLQVEADDGEGEQQLVRVFLQLGCRLLAADEGEDTQEDESTDDDFLCQVEAQYVAEYLMKEPLEQAAIDEFATENASYHVWPYWREYLSSQCLRLNLPKIILPTKQLATNRQRIKGQ